MKTISKLFPNLPDVRVVDVGASPIDGKPPYASLRSVNKMDLVAFEPDARQFEALEKLCLPRTKSIRAAIGDGSLGTLHICKSPGMTSMLEPLKDVLAQFHGFPEWGTVVDRQPMLTRRLDDVEEARGCHYLKLDVQGGELAILKNAKETLKDCLVIHTEVQFVPFYKDQPLFAELDQELRKSGFWLHRFLPIHSRVFKPLIVNNDIYAGMSQDLWTDAVYVRRFTDFHKMDKESLERIALIAHDLYGSYDLTSLALSHIDKRDGGNRQPEYVRAMSQGVNA